MDDDHGLLERLRAGDEGAFQALVERHDPALRRVARTFVRTSTAADEVCCCTARVPGCVPPSCH